MAIEQITFGKDDLTGYLVGDVNDPAVIVIQEWWGVTEVIKDHARKIAAHGYRCLIPDVYHGKIGVDKEEASHLLSKLDWQVAVKELSEAVSYLKEHGSTKIGCIGFCMGGALTLAAAQHCEIDCAQPFYGTPSLELAQPEKINVPVAIHCGELDSLQGFSDSATMKSWADKINAAGNTTAECYLYPQCGHAFLNVGEEGIEKRKHMEFPEPPEEQQELAWKRVLDFFAKYLKANA